MKNKAIWILISITFVAFTFFYFKNTEKHPDSFETSAIQFMQNELKKDLNIQLAAVLNTRMQEKDLLVNKIIERSTFRLINKTDSPDKSTKIEYEILTLDFAELRSIQDSYIKALIENTKWTQTEIKSYLDKIIPNQMNRVIVNSTNVQFAEGKLVPRSN